MRHYFLTIFILFAASFFPVASNADERVNHDLTVSVYPPENRLVAEDRIILPEKFLTDCRFLLHEGLSPLVLTPGVTLIKEGKGKAFVESYRVVLPPDTRTFTIRYGGRIHHPIEPYGTEYARGFRMTPGTISDEGVYLAGSTYWYPRFDQARVSFNLRVTLSEDWDAVSQGERTRHIREKGLTGVSWGSPEPQDEIYLVAARFVEYERSSGPTKDMVFLRSPDEKLADKYLDATARYIAMYNKLIGPYLYKKFALVENFWETGLGMPSFTLLGQKIIRFPFIIDSSYPHEILHNWWGNGVFPDYEKGNWSEGLTAYLSDYLIQEQRHNAVAYRQTTLQKYTDYVSRGKDFPLIKFTTRHDSPTEAVGYGKSLMFFHMLRRLLGDKLFISGLQDFYRENKFQTASYEDLRRSFERVSKEDLKVEFNHWSERVGAPELKVRHAVVRSLNGDYELIAQMEQKQPGDAYRIRVPVVVTLEGKEDAYRDIEVMDKKQQDMKIRLPSRPLRLDIDPQFDVFRKLDRHEVPPALTESFGANEVMIILPSAGRISLQEGYRELGRAWMQSGPDRVEMHFDDELEKLPSDRAVVIFGWENRFLDVFKGAVSKYDVVIGPNRVRVGETEIPLENHAVVLTARHPENSESSFTWVASDRVEAIPGLSRKLPHYQKYSYLGFEGAEPTNMAKGRLPVLDSPLTIFIPDEQGHVSRVQMGRLPHREPLAFLPPVFSKERMMETIRILSGDDMEGRGSGSKGLDRAAEFIAERFKEAGLRPAGDLQGSWFQEWKDTKDPERKITLKNVIGVIPGRGKNNQSVVLGAHYDHLGLGRPDVRPGNQGKIHPGADDNASGIAVLIELARVLSKDLNPDRNVVFAAFTGEETGKKGSRYYVSHEKAFPMEQCIGMINLDTVGRLANKKLLILGAGSADEWIHIFRGAGFVTGVEIEILPEELDSSDQTSFIEAGVPAVQLFSGPHLDYHRPTDTVEKIDADGLVKVASVTKEAVEYLSHRADPLSSNLKSTPGGGILSRKGSRRVALGTLPDYAFRGEGCRLSGVVPGSPASNAGLKEGDIIVRVEGHVIRSLQDFSDALKSLDPGDRISITLLREEKTMTVDAEVEAR